MKRKLKNRNRYFVLLHHKTDICNHTAISIAYLHLHFPFKICFPFFLQKIPSNISTIYLIFNVQDDYIKLLPKLPMLPEILHSCSSGIVAALLRTIFRIFMISDDSDLNGNVFFWLFRVFKTNVKSFTIVFITKLMVLSSRNMCMLLKWKFY